MRDPKYGWIIEDEDDVPSNKSTKKDFYDVIEKRLSRRDALKILGVSALATLVPLRFPNRSSAQESSLAFQELAHGLDEDFHVAEGYEYEVLLKWGDPIIRGASRFDPQKQTAKDQERQFGFNNDFISFFPLPRGSNSSDHGLLVVNHEYAEPERMFPGSPKDPELNEEQIDVTMMAHGVSVVEVKRVGGKWTFVKNSRYNRRITPTTRMRISGPVKGHPRMKTNYSTDGVKTWGTFNNCGGGSTPWGTVLIAEENIQNYYMGDPGKTKEAENYKRFGITGKARFSWGKNHDRFNLDKNPQEALHTGWIVEFDPYNRRSIPKKRTTLGRVKHEACNTWINKDNRIVAYTGDDQRFEYVYRFVSEGKYNPRSSRANRNLLDRGELSVAEFLEDGRVIWHPLVYGIGPLTQTNGFNSQADVLLDTRKAADLLGATPMDRPEDIETNPKTGTVFVMLTNNTKRKPDQLNAANTRANNVFGHIIEMKAPNSDHSASEFTWDFFLLCGDPQNPEHSSQYNPNTSKDGWLANPDNCAFDNRGRLWIATDGAYKKGFADGVWACDVEGPAKALPKHFLRTPTGAELCGPCFTPDNQTFFVSIQHPGEQGTFDKPTTRWPNFDEKYPAQPSLVAITRKGGGEIGT